MSDKEKSSKHAERPLHLCKLRKEGLMEEIDRCSAHALFICCKCNAKADRAEFLCQPRPL
ncbi:MAG: hypothetical protein U1D97_03910 [Desulfuromonadales bacterium]|nr:hypothetical protein [Desulfuromonadales bacterium]